MATTTTNFGWDIPQSTDLVKDGATAIAALGQDIDTSMVDLKGGTTGQVLSKASNTDMDFTWVAQDDSNAIQNAIVDAKGDLISATAADTPARLAVGTDGQVLTADSTTATGLKWAAASSGGTYSTWTPTRTNWSLGNGTEIARYTQIGKFVHVIYYLTWGSTSSISSDWQISLPVNYNGTNGNMEFTGSASFLDSGVAWYVGRVSMDPGSNKIGVIFDNSSTTWLSYSSLSNSGGPFSLGTNDRVYLDLVYEAA